jgi:hypothetical protein
MVGFGDIAAVSRGPLGHVNPPSKSAEFHNPSPSLRPLIFVVVLDL